MPSMTTEIKISRQSIGNSNVKWHFLRSVFLCFVNWLAELVSLLLIFASSSFPLQFVILDLLQYCVASGLLSAWIARSIIIDSAFVR